MDRCTLWQIETQHRAKYVVSSLVHSMLDFFNDLLLLVAALGIGPIQAYRGDPKSGGFARVLVPILLSLTVWQLRILQLALFSRREVHMHMHMHMRI